MKKIVSSTLVIVTLTVIAFSGWWLVSRLIERNAESLFQARSVIVRQTPITWTIQPQLREIMEPPTEVQLGTGMIQFDPAELYFFGESVRRLESGEEIVVEAQASDWLLYFLREGDVYAKRVNFFIPQPSGLIFTPAVDTDLDIDLDTGRMLITITAWNEEDLWPYHERYGVLWIDIPFYYRGREGSAFFAGPTIEFEF